MLPTLDEPWTVTSDGRSGLAHRVSVIACRQTWSREHMTTIDLVNPEQREAVGGFAGPFDPDGPDSVAAFRTNLVAGATALLSPDPSKAETVTIPAVDDRPDLRVLIHRPEALTGPPPVVLYFHGGGLLAGTPDMMVGASDKIARETGSVVVAPDYRLAPEHRFPAALDDAYATLIWIKDNAANLGIDPDRISVWATAPAVCCRQALRSWRATAAR
jgi:acetyl esterase/lipase